MGETETIAKMANLLSDDILSVFKWTKSGPLNQNWECINSSGHNERQRHPSDVVFYYDEPYTSSRTYINIDLKSYAKGSISTSQINGAIHNLTQSVECANGSADWQELYIHEGKSFQVHGLLFIFNHDGAYDSDFHNLLTKCEVNTDNLPSQSAVGVWGPEKVCYLNTIANDILLSLAKLKCDKYEFFYPDLTRRAKVIGEWKAAASFEMLSSPFIVVKYKENLNEHEFGIYLYYARKGESREEFMYVIEYLFNYQVFQNASKIEIKLPSASPNAISQFEKAKEQYLEECGEDSKDLADRLSIISASTVKQVVPQFSEVEIGMRDA